MAMSREEYEDLVVHTFAKQFGYTPEQTLNLSWRRVQLELAFLAVDVEMLKSAVQNKS